MGKPIILLKDQPFGTLVHIFHNLHPHMGAVVDPELKRWTARSVGSTLFHCPELYLETVSSFIDEEKRQEALKSRRTNLHASVVGSLTEPVVANWKKIIYIPTKHETFVYADSEEPFVSADHAWFNAEGVFVNDN